MDLSSISTSSASLHNTPLTATRRQHRRDNNLRMYCGRKGHFTNAYPSKLNNRIKFASSTPTLSTILLDSNNKPIATTSSSPSHDQLVLNSITLDNTNLISNDKRRRSIEELENSYKNSNFCKKKNLPPNSTPLESTMYISESIDLNLFYELR